MRKYALTWVAALIFWVLSNHHMVATVVWLYFTLAMIAEEVNVRRRNAENTVNGGTGSGSILSGLMARFKRSGQDDEDE